MWWHSKPASSLPSLAGGGVPPRRPAVFLDRDGTLNHDTGYVYRSADFRWLPGAVNAIRRLNDGGYYVFVVTNQSGVARGIYDEAAIRDLQGWMNEELRAAGARIDDMRYCPHHPQGSIAAYRTTCSCRKPAAGIAAAIVPAGGLEGFVRELLSQREAAWPRSTCSPD